jgi:hypothetical protein
MRQVSRTKTPIFSYIDTHFGNGIVGGPLISIKDYARQAASVAAQILAGEPPGNIKTSAIESSTPKSDRRELQRWNIGESRLPAGSEIHFRSAGGRWGAQMLLKANPPDLPQIGDILADIVRDEQRASEIITGLRNLLNDRKEAGLQALDLNDTVADQTLRDRR